MEDEQRQAMFDGWKAKLKFINIKVDLWKSGKDPQYRAYTVRKDESQPSLECIRDTRQQAIYALSGEVKNAGFEVGNLSEIYGITSTLIKSDAIPEGPYEQTVNTGPVKDMARQELEQQIEEMRVEMQELLDEVKKLKQKVKNQASKSLVRGPMRGANGKRL